MNKIQDSINLSFGKACIVTEVKKRLIVLLKIANSEKP